MPVSTSLRNWCLASAIALAIPGAVPLLLAEDGLNRRISPPNDVVLQYPTPAVRPALVQVTSLLHVAEARNQFSVDGTGLTVAVLDTGLRTTHIDFAGGKVAAQKNYTSDNSGNLNNAADGDGHGTNVAGIICAKGNHTGMAPGAKVIPMKVLGNNGSGSFSAVVSALDWVIANRTTYNISVVNMSLGDSGNYTSDSGFSGDVVRGRIATLRAARVAVCVAAGNDFYEHSSQEGMCFPAICRETVSVGATYDANIGQVSYGGATAFTTAAGRITPFSQRLHSTTNGSTRTDILAPGAAITSSGIQNDQAESTAHGTSQATPVTAGLILLAQQYWLREKGSLPTVDQLETWLRKSKYTNIDGNDEDDNVSHNNKMYINADALELLTVVKNAADVVITPPVPVNNVVAVYNATSKVLTLTGDESANSVTVTYQAGTVKVKGGGATTINSGTAEFTASVTNPFSISADLKQENDTLVITGAPLKLLAVNLGEGNDKLQLSLCNVTTLSLDGGSGTDVYIPTSSTVTRKSINRVP